MLFDPGVIEPAPEFHPWLAAPAGLGVLRKISLASPAPPTASACVRWPHHAQITGGQAAASTKASHARSGNNHLTQTRTHAGVPSALATTYRTCSIILELCVACMGHLYVLARPSLLRYTHLWVAARNRVHDRVRRHLRRVRQERGQSVSE